MNSPLKAASYRLSDSPSDQARVLNQFSLWNQALSLSIVPALVLVLILDKLRRQAGVSLYVPSFR